MRKNFVFLALITAVLVTSGCIDAMDEETYDEETPEELEEPEEPEQETEESEEESNGAETSDDYENSSETEDSASSEEVDTEIQVTGGSHYFEQDELEVEQGEKVEIIFENEGGTHDLVIPELNVGTEIIGGGETDSFTYTFDEEGEYDFECSVGTHAEQGMTGTITVT